MSRLPAAERREQLLDCAAALFSRKGYAGATTAELARAAGVTEPIIYRHFSSKRELFVALIARTGERTLQQWQQDLEGATDPGDRLRRLIGDNPMVSEQGREAYRVFLQAITEVNDPDDSTIRDAVHEHIAALHTFLKHEVGQAQETKRVTTRFSADLIAWLLIYMGLGYGLSSALGIQGHGVDAESGTHVQDVIARVLVGRDRADSDSPG